MAAYERTFIEVFDEHLNHLGVLFEFKDLEFTAKHLQSGNFSFSCSANYLNLVKVNRLIYIRYQSNDSSFDKNPAGIIRSIELDSVNDIILVSGFSIEDIFEYRPCWADTSFTKGATVTEETITSMLTGWKNGPETLGTESGYPLQCAEILVSTFSGTVQEDFTIKAHNSVLEALRLIEKNIALDCIIGVQLYVGPSDTVIRLGRLKGKQQGMIKPGVQSEGSSATYTRSYQDSYNLKWNNLCYKNSSSAAVTSHPYLEGDLPEEKYRGLLLKAYLDSYETDTTLSASDITKRKTDIKDRNIEVITEIEENYDFVARAEDYDFWIGDKVLVIDPDLKQVRGVNTIELYLTEVQYVISNGRAILLGTLSQSLEKGE